jgi:hypothetical protein
LLSARRSTVAEIDFKTTEKATTAAVYSRMARHPPLTVPRQSFDLLAQQISFE